MVRAELEMALTSFMDRHPDGWNHGDWETLLTDLAEGGLDVSDPDAIGLELERQRVLRFLDDAAVTGIGPKRRTALAQRFPSLWDLRNASVEDLSSLPTIHRGLAESLRRVLS